MAQQLRPDEPLDLLARKIEEHAQQSEDHVLQAAKLVSEARRRVEAGEAGKEVKWYGWARKNINLSSSRLRELQRIAQAENPAKELERLRKLTQKRVEDYREKKATESHNLDEERRDLIAWAKNAPIEEVRRVLGLTASNDNSAGSIGGRLGPADEQAA